MSQEITILLQAHRRGDADAVERLYPLVQAELRRGAAALLRRERDAHSVQATELVNISDTITIAGLATKPRIPFGEFGPLPSRAVGEVDRRIYR